jgi:hypothetical protein
MTWFKVDDGFHSHPKTAATSLAAIGLWTVSGSWSSDHLQDGVVPDHMIPSLARGQMELADELVRTGLWRRIRGGYKFHQWETNGDGGKRNPTRAEVEALRLKRAEAGRKGGLVSGNTRRSKASKPQANSEAKGKGSLEPPTRPSSSKKKRGSDDAALRGRASPPQCPHHQGQPAHNCAICRSEQLAERKATP